MDQIWVSVVSTESMQGTFESLSAEGPHMTLYTTRSNVAKVNFIFKH